MNPFDKVDPLINKEIYNLLFLKNNKINKIIERNRNNKEKLKEFNLLLKEKLKEFENSSIIAQDQLI